MTALKIWLVKDAEPLPLTPDVQRYRMGALADALHARGHNITWWASTFQHFHKKHVQHGDVTLEIDDRWRFCLIEAGGYSHNLSFRRALHHRTLARRFTEQARAHPAPEVIITALPIPSFAEAAVSHARGCGVPAIVDIRDLWPDVLIQKFPPYARPLATWAAMPMHAQTTTSLRNASALVAVSEGYLRWGLTKAGRSRRNLDSVIPLGYRLPAIEKDRVACPALTKILDNTADGMIVAFIGSFGVSYDLTTVCNAARSMWAEGIRNVHFVLGGDGQQMPALRRAAADIGNLHLPGWLAAADMDTLLRRSSLGIVCCRSVPDTIPNKIYQYLAYGLPILSSLEGEASDLISSADIGASYACGDTKAVVNLIKSWLDNPPLMRKMSQNARSIYVSEYDPRTIDTRYVDLIETIAEQPPSQ